MPWIAVDCQMPKHHKMAALPSDAARWGWLVTLTEAKQQRNAGTFASRAHFRHVLGGYGRYVEAYIEAGLLDEGNDGSLTIHDWRRHQWAASKSRSREDEGETSGGTDVDTDRTESGLVRASRAVAVSVDVSSTEGGAGGNLLRLVEELTNRPFGFTPGSKPWVTLQEDVASMGTEAVAAAYRQTVAEAGRPLDAAGVIYGGHKRLFPIPDGPRKVDGEDPAVVAERRRKREERNARELAYQRSISGLD